VKLFLFSYIPIPFAFATFVKNYFDKGRLIPILNIPLTIYTSRTPNIPLESKPFLTATTIFALKLFHELNPPKIIFVLELECTSLLSFSSGSFS
jgi:hypothetical protein